MEKKWMTVEEHHKILAQDPKYQAMMAEKAKRRADMEALFEADQKPLVAALVATGRSVKSVWDLVNTAESYPESIPVLAQHLSRPYHFRTREGIARALTVKEARGAVAHVVLAELKKISETKDAVEDDYRTALANALVKIGDASMLEDVRQMLGDPHYTKVQSELENVIKTITKRKPPRAEK
jgi:hypothetical protein